ncbi:hypothetical protein XENORESO_003152 [Xenotaenia resolanae]|uniref:Secreted protein n=1 Tax=Xenotaenia resolanae TaxID=208358 RepID=A0ABV0W6E6_9TELE
MIVFILIDLLIFILGVWNQLSDADVHSAQRSSTVCSRSLQTSKLYVAFNPPPSWGCVFQELGFPTWFQERKSECFSIPRDFGQFHAPSLVGTVWRWPLPT